MERVIPQDINYQYISFDKLNNAIVSGTNIKVKDIIVQKLAYGWSPEEIHFQHPTLSLSQIYSLLAYYYDHEEEFTENIQHDLDLFDKNIQNKPSVFRKRIMDQNLI
jgi:uncharacterized protein (DUF433 family)